MGKPNTQETLYITWFATTWSELEKANWANQTSAGRVLIASNDDLWAATQHIHSLGVVEYLKQKYGRIPKDAIIIAIRRADLHETIYVNIPNYIFPTKINKYASGKGSAPIKTGQLRMTLEYSPKKIEVPVLWYKTADAHSVGLDMPNTDQLRKLLFSTWKSGFSDMIYALAHPHMPHIKFTNEGPAVQESIIKAIFCQDKRK